MISTRILKKMSALAALALLFALTAHADSVTLSSGETFTGQLSRIVEGTLVFRTTLSGQMMVPMDTVQRLSTERNFVVSLTDKRVHYGRLDVGKQDGHEQLVPIEGGSPIPFSLAEVTEAVPLRSAPAESPGNATPSTSGLAMDVEAGARWREGNEGRVEPVGRLQLSGGEEGSRLTADVEVAHSGVDEAPGYASANLLVEDVSGATGPYGRFEALRNADAALAVRARLGLGLRHLLYEDDAASLALYAGGAAALEHWDAGLVPNDRERFWASDTKSTESLELELGLRYSQAVFGNSRLEGSVGVYPSLTEPGEFRASSDAVLRVPLNSAVQLRLNLRFYYESDPPFARLDPWETSVGAGFAVEF